MMLSPIQTTTDVPARQRATVRTAAPTQAVQNAQDTLDTCTTQAARKQEASVTANPVLRAASHSRLGLSAGKMVTLAAGVIGSLVGTTHAYPCTGYNADADQYFQNANATLYGVVHGWFSDCYDYTYPCGQSCSSSGSGSSSSTSCTTIYCTATETDRSPRDYVSVAASKVGACGFAMVTKVPGEPGVRIANALIERNLWVKVSVNTLNITDVTDPAIACLHNIA